MMRTDATLGDISQTERAKAETLPDGNLPAEQRRVYLAVESWKRANPDASAKRCYEAVAAILGKNVGTVQGTYSVAKRKLEGNDRWNRGGMIRPGDPILRSVAREEPAPTPRPRMVMSQEEANRRAELADRDRGTVRDPHRLDLAAPDPGPDEPEDEDPPEGEDAPLAPQEAPQDRAEAPPPPEPSADPFEAIEQVLAWLRPLTEDDRRRVLAAATAFFSARLAAAP